MNASIIENNLGIGNSIRFASRGGMACFLTGVERKTHCSIIREPKNKTEKAFFKKAVKVLQGFLLLRVTYDDGH